MSLSVRDLVTRMQARQAKRHQCFDKVLEKCFAHIERHASKDQHFCFYEVPHIMMGFPIYDLNECIKYLIQKLEHQEFLVKYYFPQILYISWNVNEINEEKVTKGMSLLQALDGPSTIAQKKLRSTKAVAKKSLVATPQASQRATTKQLTFSPTTTTTPSAPVQKTGFLKSVKQFKPSGKLVLDLI